MSDEGGFSSPASPSSPTLSGPELEKALKECANEKIQIPGFIQPNGVLFCVEKKTLRVLQVSANVEAVLGIPLNTIIPTKATEDKFPYPFLPDLLGLDAAQTAALTSTELVDFSLPLCPPNSSPHSSQKSHKDQESSMREFTAFCSHVPSPSVSLQLFGALSSSNYDEGIKMLTVEVEPCIDSEARYKRSRLQQKALQRLSRRLASTSDILEACRVAAEEVHHVTGLDRVMVYEFDREWHGDILFELTAEGIPQIYSGLRFPASDIPPQARRLYTINPFRLISNTFYEPCPVLPTINPLTNSPLDMSHATFRSVSPIHVQYLKNIDVGCSMSISIIVNDIKTQNKKLFGLLVCHNRTPVFLPYDVRETCMIIGQLMSLRVENLLHNKMEEKRIAMKDMVHSIATTHLSAPATPVHPDSQQEPKKDLSVLIAKQSDNDWTQMEAPYAPSHPLVSLASGSGSNSLEPDTYALEVLRMFDADYGLIVVEGRRRILGSAAASEVVFLASFEEYVALHNPTQILHESNLAKSLPKALPLADGFTTSGLLYIPLSLDASSYLALFRYEQIVHVRWAGAPQKKFGVHPVTSQPTLVPRSSFHAWTEEVRGTSRQWTELEIETAHSLFVNLMELMRFIRLRVRMVEETIARQKIEQEKMIADESNKMKTQFLANLSHEVRTPLNAIIGMVDLTLATTKVDSTQANYLAAVQHASESLLLIINDLLDISKIEAGKLVLMNDTFDLGKLVEQTVSAYKISIERKGVAFNLDIDPNIPTVISTDSVRLCQVLTNLLSNAKKYTINGSITMKIFMISELSEVPNRKASPRLLLQPGTPPSTPNSQGEEEEKEKGREMVKVESNAKDEIKKEETAAERAEKIYLHFSIIDTGIGIPDEKIDSVFEPFEQVESQLTRKVGGTGLGLSICRRIVRLMGGYLWCESIFNHGSTFHFEIPVETGATRTTPDGSAVSPRNGTDFLTPVSHNGMFVRPYAEVPDLPVSGGKDPEEVPKVLVVEDNQLNQKVAVNFLRRLNITTDVAGNGEVALNLYRENPDRYGAILMDVCMPVMDGLVASREIRAFETTAGRSPRLNTASIALSAAEGSLSPGNQKSRSSLSSSGHYRRVPIVALSAQVMDQDRDACMLAGMDGFLEKPVRFENLRKLLEPIYSHYPKWQNPLSG